MFAIVAIALMFCLVLFVAAYPTGQTLPLYRLQLTPIKFIVILLSVVFLGFQLGISIPIFVILLIVCIYTLKFRNKVGITILGVFFGLCSMIISVTSYIHNNHLEHEYFAGAAYFYGIIPAILFGGGLGSYLAFQIKEVNGNSEKRRIRGFLYKPVEKPWSSKE